MSRPDKLLEVLAMRWLFLLFLTLGCGDLNNESGNANKNKNSNKNTNKNTNSDKSSDKEKTVANCYDLESKSNRCSDDYVEGRRSNHHPCLVMYERYLDCCVSKTHVCYD